MTGDEPVPPIRVESEDEILDDSAPRLGPLPTFRLRGLRNVRRFRRTLQALGLAAVVAAGAVVGGVTTHDADRRAAAQDVHGKTLLHLIGGEGLLQQGDGYPSDLSAIRSVISFAFRNDGPDPVNVVRADLAQPGITVLASQTSEDILPGQTAIVDLQIAIDCDDVKLPRSPDTITLAVRGPAKKTSSIAFPLAQPPGETTSGSLDQQLYESGGAQTYFDICGLAASAAPVDVAYGGLTARASAANPEFAFTVRVIATGQPKAVVGYSDTSAVPGLDVSTDLAGTTVAKVDTPLTVKVTMRATDCALLGNSLLAMTGGDLLNGVENLVNQPVVLVGQADPRFPTFDEPVNVDQNSSAFSTDFLSQLAAACPTLQ